MKISLCESFHCSLFTLHYWAYTGADLPRGQGGHSSLLALPVNGTLHITCRSTLPCRVLSTALQLLPHQFTCYFILHTGQVKTVHLHPTAETLVIPCSGSLPSYLLIEKIIANLACVTQEQLMEMTAFPSILLSFFSCPEEYQHLSSTVDSEAW